MKVLIVEKSKITGKKEVTDIYDKVKHVNYLLGTYTIEFFNEEDESKIIIQSEINSLNELLFNHKLDSDMVIVTIEII